MYVYCLSSHEAWIARLNGVGRADSRPPGYCNWDRLCALWTRQRFLRARNLGLALRICTAKVILHCFNKGGGGGVITECRGIEPEQTKKILTIFVIDQCKNDSVNQNT